MSEAPLFVVGIGASGTGAGALVVAGRAALAAHPFITERAASRLYANPAVGGATHERFVNAAVVVQSALHPSALLRALFAVETRFGRVRGRRDGARTLDLDVLLALAVRAPLATPTTPHPRLLGRPFAVVPAAEALARAGLPCPRAVRRAAAAASSVTLLPVGDLDSLQAGT